MAAGLISRYLEGHLIIKQDIQVIKLLKAAQNASRTRQALNVSQSTMAEIVSAYMPGQVTAKAISLWECYDRHRRPAYRPSKEAVKAYKQIIKDLCRACAGPEVKVKCRGRYTWRWRALRPCARCGRDFILARSRDKSCGRCRNKDRR